MARIHLIAWDNQRGLSHDIRVMADALAALGHDVHISRLGSKRRDGTWTLHALRLRRWLGWLFSGGRQPAKFDMNLSLEHVRPASFGLARIDVLMPNPEWMSLRSQRYLPRFDALLTKTAEASRIFSSRGLRTLHVGFRSRDCYDPDVVRTPHAFLHVAGASDLKGTARLIAVWKRHPEWPRLRVLRAGASEEEAQTECANIEVVRTYLPADEVRRLQNEYAFHICLSETEGWGHYLVEAMSCAAVAITCDAPPMNELVTEDRGLLVAVGEPRPFNAALAYPFDEASLERTIARAIAMPDDERERLGVNARTWFLDNDAGFTDRLDRALRDLL
ncbi:glycosyl transferase family 1 [Luteibacter rhizovicinus]|uniref:Glycosyl transferase family 1 n=1 Tax=Luteibacter rhizovicinus TaxID=242606 RepID=A0A4R3YXW5_9GAMM|nr:glycosyltransferase [Luteibacter rhizovicinus]TCV96314.1 glycosyl transferase family 1 [Luteibacter rhizovicinus]